MGFKKHNPGCDCCPAAGDAKYDCAICTGGTTSGNTPSTYKVVLSSLSTNLCSSTGFCNGWEGTWTLPNCFPEPSTGDVLDCAHRNQTGRPGCEYEFFSNMTNPSTSTTGCDACHNVDYLEAQAIGTTSNKTFRVRANSHFVAPGSCVNNSTIAWLFEKNYGSGAMNCNSFANEVIPATTDITQTNEGCLATTSSSCKVTAL